MLQAYNFPTQLINLIKSCLSNTDYTPIINGTKHQPLKPNRGIRQGDPLSPYLFILVMNYLSAMITNSVSNGDWKPFKITNSDVNISHLLFADDVLLFAKANSHSISSIKTIFDSFCKISSMEINLNKSKLRLSPHTPQNRRTYISNFLQINISHNLGSYLGYPLKPPYKTSNFNFIILKLRQKLPGWKMNHLSFVCRSHLVQATLNHIPNYQMRVFCLPKKLQT